MVVVGICADNRTAFTATPARRKGLTVKISRRMKPVYPRTIALAAHGMVDLRDLRLPSGSARGGAAGLPGAGRLP